MHENRKNVNYHHVRNDSALKFVDIKSPRFFGTYNTSLNGLYAIACSDSDYQSSNGGCRESGCGRYALLSGQNILLWGKIPRPYGGQVADNGTFIINDLMFGNELRGTFFAFNRQGAILVKKMVNAHILNLGISDNGSYACFQTANSDNNNDGNSLFIYKLFNGTQISQFSPLCGVASKYCFDETNALIHLIYNTEKSYRFSFQGDFIDKELWLQDREREATGYFAFELAKEKLALIKSTTLSDYTGVISLLERSVAEELSDYTKARVNRIWGEIHYKCEDVSNAVRYFEMAIIFDKKIGVKKLLEKLKSSPS